MRSGRCWTLPLWALGALALLCVTAAPAGAHPVPFSYLDLRLDQDTLDGTLVIHIIDIAHDLGIEPAERLLDLEFAREQRDAIAALIAGRLSLASRGQRIPLRWTVAEVLPSRQSIRLHARAPLGRPASHVSVDGVLFPYDANHRTFVTLYDDYAVSQAILDASRPRHEYFAGTAPGRLAVVDTFARSGLHHILIGPDHILFLFGLLLLGGSTRRLALVVTGFTVGHSVTLSLAALGILNPPAAIVEPIIALSIVYVGLDNLLKRDGRDVRVWIALGFGLIHGFGFAGVLRDVGLPAGALGWSLFSFNLGVEVGQLLVVAVMAMALAAVRAQSAVLGRRLVLAGSLTVIAGGGYWFVERLGVLGGW